MHICIYICICICICICEYICMFDVGESNAKYVYTPCQRGLAKARSRWADLRGRVEISGPPKEDRQTRKNPRLSINGGGCIEMFDSVILFPIHFHMYIYIYLYAYIHVTHLFSIYFSSFQTMQRIAAAICGEWYTLGTIWVQSGLFRIVHKPSS